MNRRLTLYYDEDCPRCSRWARRINQIVEVDILPLRSNGLLQRDIDPLLALRAIPARTEKGRILYGFDVVHLFVKKIWWLRPIWPITFFLKKIGLGNYLYRYFADRRKICSKDCGNLFGKHLQFFLSYVLFLLFLLYNCPIV